MKINDFESAFITDLEAFVRKSAVWEVPPIKWNHLKIASPERHKVLGYEGGLSPQSQINLLKRNQPFDTIDSILGIQMKPYDYIDINISTFDKEAEQVWLFGYRWLDQYNECLKEPSVIRSVFYRYHHNRFLELMRKMLAVNPKKRITFSDALKGWFPESSVFVSHSSSEEDNHSMTTPFQTEVEDKKEESLSEYHNHQPPVEDKKEESLDECRILSQSDNKPVEKPHADLPSSCDPVPPVVPQPVVSSVRSRLVLKRPDDHEERNKTRRSPRNSGRSQ